jgi:transcriptional regulator with XRE-family HTH domain
LSPSALSVHPSAPQEPVRRGASQYTDKADALGKVPIDAADQRVAVRPSAVQRARQRKGLVMSSEHAAKILSPSALSVHPSAPQEPVRSGASQCTDKADALVASYRVPPTMKCSRRNRVIPHRHDDSMVKLQQARTARHLQANRRRIIEQRRLWGRRISWPERPSPGWLAEVRQASGLSTRDLAQRLEVAHSTVVRVEASERNDAIQLGMLRRYADAMDADLRYIILPRASVLETTDSQGRKRRAHLRLKAKRADPRRITPVPC